MTSTKAAGLITTQGWTIALTPAGQAALNAAWGC